VVPKLRGQHESVVHAEAREHEIEAVVELGVGHAEVFMRPMALSMVKPTITPAATADLVEQGVPSLEENYMPQTHLPRIMHNTARPTAMKSTGNAQGAKPIATIVAWPVAASAFHT
jgi:hypothetical protein